MTTTGELHAIIEELALVDIGDAARYLGEELAEDAGEDSGQAAFYFASDTEEECTTCDCSS